MFSSPEEINTVENGCKTARIGCIECKQILSKNMNVALSPFREKKRELDNNRDYVLDVLEDGRKSCSAIASETMKEVREKIGVMY